MFVCVDDVFVCLLVCQLVKLCMCLFALVMCLCVCSCASVLSCVFVCSR